MAQKIKINLNDLKSIREAKRQLEEYRDSLQRKCEEFVRRLSEIGLKVASEKINESKMSRHITLTSEITPEQAGCRAIITAIGETVHHEGYAPFNLLLAIEFGAGTYYNKGNENPKADLFGLGVGTFPGQTHAFQDGWWYLGDDDEWHYSHGVKATMPMYNASIGMYTEIHRIAKEVFGNG